MPNKFQISQVCLLDVRGKITTNRGQIERKEHCQKDTLKGKKKEQVQKKIVYAMRKRER